MRYMESVSGGGESEIDVSTGVIRVIERSLTEDFGGIMGKVEIFRKGGKENVIYMLSKVFDLSEG